MADWIHGTAGASMAKMVVTDRDGNVHVVEGRVGVKLMETLREFDYGVTAICGGLCSCATCHVFVKPEWMGRLPVPQGDEKELLVELQNYDAPSSRLSCQVDFTEALDGLEIKIAPDE
jgi:2Fe-2S ferredoxin